MWLFFGTALVALAADVLSKVLVVAHIQPTDPGVRLLGGAVYLVQARNSGAAFSVGTGATVVLTGISILVVVIMLRAARRLTSSGWAVALGLVLGGAIGNLVDRLVREPGVGRGHVVDFIAYGHLFIGNVADIAIVAAAVLMAVLSVRGIGLDGVRLTPRRSAPGDVRG
jgi:signal peptidase II